MDVVGWDECARARGAMSAPFPVTCCGGEVQHEPAPWLPENYHAKVSEKRIEHTKLQKNRYTAGRKCT